MGVRELFRNKGQTEFIIATIPTALGVQESNRLAIALAKEQIPCRRIIVNQAGLALPASYCSAYCMIRHLQAVAGLGPELACWAGAMCCMSAT